MWPSPTMISEVQLAVPHAQPPGLLHTAVKSVLHTAVHEKCRDVNHLYVER